MASELPTPFPAAESLFSNNYNGLGDPPRVFFIVCFCLVFVGYVAFMALNFHLRAFPPIRGRNLPMVFLASMLVLEGVANTIFQLILGDRVDIADTVRRPVVFRSVLSVICIFLLVVAFTLRTWALLLAFRIARRGQEHVRSGGVDPAARAWFVRMRFLKSHRLHYGIFCLAALYISAGFAILLPGAPNKSLASSVFGVTNTLAVMAIAVVLTCLMRSFSDDGYFIKTELTMCGWIGLVTLVVSLGGIVFEVQEKPKAALLFQDSSLLFAYVGVGVFALAIPYFRARQGVQVMSMFKDAGLGDLLRNPALRAKFREFLLSEFSAENLDFCEAVEALEALVNVPPAAANPALSIRLSWADLSVHTSAVPEAGLPPGERVLAGEALPFPAAAAHAMRGIVDCYVAHAASFEVNISSEESGLIRKHFEAGDELGTFHALVAAKGTVFALIKRDSLPRFKVLVLRKRFAVPTWQQKEVPTAGSEQTTL